MKCLGSNPHFSFHVISREMKHNLMEEVITDPPPKPPPQTQYTNISYRFITAVRFTSVLADILSSLIVASLKQGKIIFIVQCWNTHFKKDIERIILSMFSITALFVYLLISRRWLKLKSPIICLHFAYYIHFTYLTFNFKFVHKIFHPTCSTDISRKQFPSTQQLN